MDPMTVVAATDFSGAARAAVDRAALIALEHEARLSLVHAFDEVSWKNLRSLATPKKNLFAEQPLALAGETIRAMAARLERKFRIRVSGTVAMGPASEAIAATAEAMRACVLVLGPHGGARASRLFLGSTALKVARRARCPVLVVRNTPAAAYRSCLVGVDFSPPSQRAASAAARLFPSTAITLLHAVPSIEGPMLLTGELREAVNAAKARMREQAVERLAQAFPAGQPGPLGSARRRAVAVPAVQALMRELDSGKFDLLALGRDAGREIAERVLGSVPANLLLDAPSDVLIVP